MLLLTVNPPRLPGSDERSMDFADDEAFGSPDDFPLAEPHLGAGEDVGPGGVVVPNSDEEDAADGRFGGAVPATADALPVACPDDSGSGVQFG
jgi:hypothetical protein